MENRMGPEHVRSAELPIEFVTLNEFDQMIVRFLVFGMLKPFPLPLDRQDSDRCKAGLAITESREIFSRVFPESDDKSVDPSWPAVLQMRETMKKWLGLPYIEIVESLNRTDDLYIEIVEPITPMDPLP